MMMKIIDFVCHNALKSILFSGIFFLIFITVFFLAKKKLFQAQSSFDVFKRYSRLKSAYPYFPNFIIFELSNFSLSGALLILFFFDTLPGCLLIMSIIITICVHLICWKNKRNDKNKQRIDFLLGMSLILLLTFFLTLAYVRKFHIIFPFFIAIALSIWFLNIYMFTKLYEYSFRKKRIPYIRKGNDDKQHLRIKC